MAKLNLYERRKRRVRSALRRKGSGRVRLSVFRSGKHIYAQLIDDGRDTTLAHASSLDKELKAKSGSTVEVAHKVGELIAKRAKGVKIETVVFDRGSYLYHGRVKALAEGARSGGLVF